MDFRELEDDLRAIAEESIFSDDHAGMMKIADGIAVIAQKLIAAEKLAEALRTIAYGPFPPDIIGPIEQVHFDDQIARDALAAWEAAQ